MLSWRWTGDGWGCQSNNITRSFCVWGNFLRSFPLRQNIYSSQNSITSDKISYYLNYANPPEIEKTSESRDSNHRVCFKSKRYVKRIVSKRKWLNKCCHRKWQNSFAQKECYVFDKKAFLHLKCQSNWNHWDSFTGKKALKWPMPRTLFNHCPVVLEISMYSMPVSHFIITISKLVGNVRD